MRPAVAFAVGELRKLGRTLTDGSWAKSQSELSGGRPKPMAVLQSIAVIAEALRFVADAGVGSVVERTKQMVQDYAEATRAELDFEPKSRRRK